MMLYLLLAACSSTKPDGDFVGTSSPAEDSEVDTTDAGPGISFDGKRPVNVLMISWDTTRRDHLGSLDPAGGAETDTIGALFEGGVVMANHRSCSNWTWASTICVQNGQYDFEIGWIPTSHGEYQVPVPDSFLMAGEVLAEQGYQTAMASTNAWFSSNHNMTQGVTHDEYDNDAEAEWVVDTALGFFEGGAIDPEQPWYVHAHFMDPHIPYTPPRGYRAAANALEEVPYDLDKKSGCQELERDWPELSDEERALAMAHLEALYRGELASADDQVARLLADLDERGELEDTLVVFWTDHGEQLFEHDTIGHGSDLYEAENRAVAAFYSSGIQPLSWTGPTTHVDIWPTVLDALKIPIPEDWTGLPLGERSDHSPRFAMRHDGSSDRIVQFVERDEIKLIYEWDGAKALYHLGDDPLEQENRYDPDDPEVIALWELLMPVVEATEAVHPDWSPTAPGP